MRRVYIRGQRAQQSDSMILLRYLNRPTQQFHSTVRVAHHLSRIAECASMYVAALTSPSPWPAQCSPPASPLAIFASALVDTGHKGDFGPLSAVSLALDTRLQA
jgi:hypothetical protein